MNMGVEPEMYVLRREGDDWVPWIAEDRANVPTRGYDLETTMLADAFLEPMVGYINELGWDVYSFDHEGGDGQYEFDFGYTDALAMADRMVIFRLMAKHVARSLGCIASFMPKPTKRAEWQTYNTVVGQWEEGHLPAAVVTGVLTPHPARSRCGRPSTRPPAR